MWALFFIDRWARLGGTGARSVARIGRLSLSHPIQGLRRREKTQEVGAGATDGSLSSLLGAMHAREKRVVSAAASGGYERRWRGLNSRRGDRRHDPVMAATVEKASAKARRISGNGGAPLSLSLSIVAREEGPSLSTSGCPRRLAGDLSPIHPLSLSPPRRHLPSRPCAFLATASSPPPIHFTTASCYRHDDPLSVAMSSPFPLPTRR